jgi:hypothetical protein
LGFVGPRLGMLRRGAPSPSNGSATAAAAERGCSLGAVVLMPLLRTPPPADLSASPANARPCSGDTRWPRPPRDGAPDALRSADDAPGVAPPSEAKAALDRDCDSCAPPLPILDHAAICATPLPILVPKLTAATDSRLRASRTNQRITCKRTAQVAFS